MQTLHLFPYPVVTQLLLIKAAEVSHLKYLFSVIFLKFIFLYLAFLQKMRNGCQATPPSHLFLHISLPVTVMNTSEGIILVRDRTNVYSTLTEALKGAFWWVLKKKWSRSTKIHHWRDSHNKALTQFFLHTTQSSHKDIGMHSFTHARPFFIPISWEHHVVSSWIGVCGVCVCVGDWVRFLYLHTDEDWCWVLDGSHVLLYVQPQHEGVLFMAAEILTIKGSECKEKTASLHSLVLRKVKIYPVFEILHSASCTYLEMLSIMLETRNRKYNPVTTKN